MKWQETTLRKGTKAPKICRDMYITDSRGTWRLVSMSNGRVAESEIIEEAEATDYIVNNQLMPVSSMFKGCFTYRTQASNELIDRLLNNA